MVEKAAYGTSELWHFLRNRWKMFGKKEMTDRKLLIERRHRILGHTYDDVEVAIQLWLISTFSQILAASHGVYLF